MKRGELYRVLRANIDDPKNQRVYLIVSRQEVINNHFPTVVCAPIRTKFGSLPTQVEIGVDEGLKHDSAVYCDDLTRIDKSKLTNYVGSLPNAKMEEVNIALRIALATG